MHSSQYTEFLFLIHLNKQKVDESAPVGA